MNPRPASTNRLTARFFKAWIARCATVVSVCVRISKKTLMAAGLAASLASANSKAATLIVDLPNDSGSQYGLFVESSNNDSGAVYDSTAYDMFNTLGQQMFDLGAHSYSSVDDLINSSFNLTVGGSASDQWSATSNGGQVQATHIDGDPSFGDYDEYSFGNTQTILATPDKINLEQNGTSGYQSFNFTDTQNTSWNPANYDPIVVLTGTTEANDLFNASNYNGIVPSATIDPAFVGYEGIFNYEATGPQYTLVNPNGFGAIPEPSTVGLIGLSALAYAGSRRRQDKNQDTKYD